jgi:hypothetical protein
VGRRRRGKAGRQLPGGGAAAALGCASDERARRPPQLTPRFGGRPDGTDKAKGMGGGLAASWHPPRLDIFGDGGVATQSAATTSVQGQRLRPKPATIQTEQRTEVSGAWFGIIGLILILAPAMYCPGLFWR